MAIRIEIGRNSGIQVAQHTELDFLRELRIGEDGRFGGRQKPLDERGVSLRIGAAVAAPFGVEERLAAVGSLHEDHVPQKRGGAIELLLDGGSQSGPLGGVRVDVAQSTGEYHLGAGGQ